MLRLVIGFFILLGSIYLGTQLQADPGYVLIAINHWTIETSVWFAIIGLLLMWFIIQLVLKIVHKITSTPIALSRWHEKRLAQKAQATTRRGLIEYSEGYWQKAQQHLMQALPNADTPLLNYLTAARAAQKMGDSTLRDHYLREAQQSMPEAKIAVELTQAQLQLANNQWEQALATLRHLQDLAPKHPYVLKLLMHLYQEVKDWNQLILLLPDLKRNKVISDEEFNRLQKRTYLNALAELIKQDQLPAVSDLFNTLPKTVAHNPEIIAKYAQFLMKHQQLGVAEELLRKSLRKEFHTSLIKVYAEPLQLETQLPFAESLIKKTPHSADLYLCLGQLCIHQHLWGKAKTYLEQSIELTPSIQAYNALGSLHEYLNEPLVSCEFYKKGLALAICDSSDMHHHNQP